MKKLSVLLTCVIGLLLLSGCYDKRELEDNTFVILLGIDKAGDKDVVVTIAFPLTQTEGGGANEGTDNGSGNYSVMSVIAPTLVEGLSMFSTKLAGPLALHSVKTIVVSKELAENDMLRHVLSSWRYEDIRNTANVLISECKASEFIEVRLKNPPIDPLRQEELLLEQSNNSAYYKPIQLLELLSSLESDGADGVAMLGGIAEKEESNDSKGEEKMKDKNKEKDNGEIKETVKDGYLPAEIPIKAENESRVSGLAVFQGAKMVGTLDSSEAQTYSILTQSGAKKITTMPDPLEPDRDIVVAVRPAGKISINSCAGDEIPSFDLSVRLKCNIECIQSGIDYAQPENYDILTKYISNTCKENISTLIDKVQKEYNSDILKLGDKLAYNFLTTDEWESYNWPEKYKDAEINLDVDLVIERTGIMLP